MKTQQGQKLRVAILGTLAPHKGRELVRQTLAAAEHRHIEFVLIGSSDPRLHADPEKYTETGAYADPELPELIKRSDVQIIWLPQQSPETFNFTLSAALDSGLPIVATRIGAHIERLAAHPEAWTLPADASPETWLAALEVAARSIRKPKRKTAGSAPAPKGDEGLSDAFSDWYLSSGARIARTVRAKIPRVIAVPELVDGVCYSPCAYIRLLLPLEALRRRGLIDLVVTSPGRLERCSGDVLVLQRYSATNRLEAEGIIEFARQRGMRIVYDLDDNLIEVPGKHPEQAFIRSRQPVVMDFLACADQVLVSTSPLRDLVSKYVDKSRVLLQPNRIDGELLPVREQSSRTPSAGLRGSVGILYMGTLTHDADIAMVTPALDRISRSFRNRVRLGIVGGVSRGSLPDGMVRLEMPQWSASSYPAFYSWWTSLRGWDIGIAPLAQSRFNACKSDIKALDYMAIGLSVVASDVPAYAGLPKHAAKLVANQSGDWFSALAALIEDSRRADSSAAAGSSFLREKRTYSPRSIDGLEQWRIAVG